jgi:Protein of unknown function (DUF3631)/Domain of unknown function (DUF3854)
VKKKAKSNLAVEYLRARGVKLETVLEAGGKIITRDSAPSGIWNNHLGFDRWGDQMLPDIVEEAICLPCVDSKGNVTSFIFRIFPPLPGKDGEVAKFLTPKGGNGIPFITHAVWEVAAKPHQAICLTEGPIKALALQQIGNFSIGLNGVWSATARYEVAGSFPRLDLHPALKEFTWHGRKAHLIFDADFRSNHAVKHALIRTLIVLAANSADPGVLHWDEKHKGIDDFLAGQAKGKVPLQKVFDLLCDDRLLLPKLLNHFDLEVTEMDLVNCRLNGVLLEQMCRSCARPLGMSATGLLKNITEERRRLESKTEEPLPNIEPRSLALLLDDLVALLKKYVVFLMDEEHPAILSLWVIHTWLFRAFDYTPYILIYSPSVESGKTRIFEVLSLVCRSPEKTEGATSAALIRTIDEDKPQTLLLDEMDSTYLSKAHDLEGENTRRFLNGGFKRGATFMRCVGQGADIVAKKFPAYCPKALAAITKCYPSSVSSRGIPIEIHPQVKKFSKDFLEGRERRAAKMRDRDAGALVGSLRDELRVLASDEELIKKLNEARPEISDDLGLGDRQEDICEPLLAIADEAGIAWGEKARNALKAIFNREAADLDVHTRLLFDIKQVYHGGKPDEKGKRPYEETDRLPTELLLNRLVELADDQPWPMWFEKLLKDGHIKSAGSKLAYYLERYGIRPRTIYFGKDDYGEEQTAKGYLREQFEDAWKRYLPEEVPSPVSPSGTSGRQPRGKTPDDLTTKDNPVVRDFTREPDDLTTLTAQEGDKKKKPSKPKKRLSPQKNPPPADEKESPNQNLI